MISNRYPNFIDYTLIDIPNMQFQGVIFQSLDSDQYQNHSHYFSLQDYGFLGNQMHSLVQNQLNSKDKEQLNLSPLPLGCQQLSLEVFEENSPSQSQKILSDKGYQQKMQQDNCTNSLIKERKSRHKRQKNDTKNIPKNFGKGIINFIQKNQKKALQLLSSSNLNYSDFLKMIHNRKKIINSIANLREMWIHQKYGSVMRILSNLFFRKYSFYYIFNSRISSFNTHLKYRHVLWFALSDPNSFNRIKEY